MNTAKETVLTTATATDYRIVGWVSDIRKRTWNDAGSDKYRALGASAGFEIHSLTESTTYFLKPKSKFVVIPGKTVYVIFNPQDVALISHPSDGLKTAQPPDMDAPLFDFMQSPSYRYRLRARRTGGAWL